MHHLIMSLKTRQKHQHQHQKSVAAAIVFVYKAGDFATSSSANQNAALVIAP